MSTPEAQHGAAPRASPPHRAALDDWLARADRVLAEQRQIAISPSFAAAVTADLPLVHVLPLRLVAEGLEDPLTRLTTTPGRWMLSLEDDGEPLVEFLLFEDGSLAMVTTDTADAVEGSAETLRELGWSRDGQLAQLWPTRGEQWVAIQDTITPDLTAAATLALRTLRTVHGVGDEHHVTVWMAHSPDRGSTPASRPLPESAMLPAPPVDRHSTQTDSAREPIAMRRAVREDGARAVRAWLTGRGLVGEISDLSRLDPAQPTPTPGLDEIIERLDVASYQARHFADEYLDRPGLTGWERHNVRRRCHLEMTKAEQALRRLAQLALGVSAAQDVGDHVERLDHAAVLVLNDPVTGATLEADGIELFATTAEQLVIDVAGLLCRLIIEPGVQADIGPVRVSGNWRGDLTLAHRDPTLTRGDVRTWQAPVTVILPAKWLVETLGDEPVTTSVARRSSTTRAGHGE